MTAPSPIPMRERLRMNYDWTTRQRDVLNLIARGKTNAEIGAELGISLDGAKWHVSEILSKLQAESREEAGDYWRRYNGLAPRFSRVFRGVAGAVGTKGVAAAIGVAALGATAAIVVVALTDGLGDRPSEPGTSNPSPAAPATTAPTEQAGITTAWLWDSGQPNAWVWLTADNTQIAASYGDEHADSPPARGGGVALLDGRDGHEVWRFQTDAHAFPAALTGTRVVFSTADGTVYGLDRSTGREVWRRDFPGVPFEAVTAGPVVVIADADPESGGPGGLVDKTRIAGRVWALDPATGDTRWETQVGDFSAFVDFGNDTVVVASDTGREKNEIVALRPATGERLWRVTATASFGRPLTVESSVIVPGSRLASIDLDTAYLEWATAPKNGGTFFSPTLFGESVAAMTNTGTFEVRTIGDGELIGAPQLGDCSGTPLTVGARLFVLACGALQAWHPASSGLLGYLTPQGRIQTVATSQGLLVFSSGTGHSGVKVAAIRP